MIAELKAAVRPYFDLGQDWTGNGATLREELEKSERKTGRTPKRLQVPALPHAFERPLALWQELHGWRGVGGFGLAPLSWQDLYYFTRMTGTQISEGTRAALKIIDGEFFASQSAAEEHRGKSKPVEK